ncbi:MAG: 2-oxo acid dehydrogenase subunit E2 [Clostridia bacterium]|nr:2-oxo acid dehydrogenase subunit E2 [Clostridia bacterium]
MKRKFGDRKDGTLLRDIDSMHFICPLLYPNRCDNEAFISERIDLTNLKAYLDKKNYEGIPYKYTLFLVIVAATLKTLTLRPKMNRFIANKSTYQRNEVSASFVVKKIFSDKGEEGLAFIHSKPDDTIDTIYKEVFKQVSKCRDGKEKDTSSDAMDTFTKLPRFISRTAVAFICRLDKHGWVPNSLIATDPYYSSVVLTNLGSIKLHSGYHHLTNWGTNSVFCAIGERKIRPFTDENGNIDMRDSIDIGLTIDERLADGYYYSKTVRLLKKLIVNPELLELPLSEEVEY